jgi:hypothetical protein
LAAARDRVVVAWRTLVALPEAGEYAALRMGWPIAYLELVALLAEEEGSLSHIQSPTRK